MAKHGPPPAYGPPPVYASLRALTHRPAHAISQHDNGIHLVFKDQAIWVKPEPDNAIGQPTYKVMLYVAQAAIQGRYPGVRLISHEQAVKMSSSSSPITWWQLARFLRPDLELECEAQEKTAARLMWQYEEQRERERTAKMAEAETKAKAVKTKAPSGAPPPYSQPNTRNITRPHQPSNGRSGKMESPCQCTGPCMKSCREMNPPSPNPPPYKSSEAHDGETERHLGSVDQEDVDKCSWCECDDDGYVVQCNNPDCPNHEEVSDCDTSCDRCVYDRSGVFYYCCNIHCRQNEPNLDRRGSMDEDDEEEDVSTDSESIGPN
jgi:hypothetical protein